MAGRTPWAENIAVPFPPTRLGEEPLFYPASKAPTILPLRTNQKNIALEGERQESPNSFPQKLVSIVTTPNRWSVNYDHDHAKSDAKFIG